MTRQPLGVETLDATEVVVVYMRTSSIATALPALLRSMRAGLNEEVLPAVRPAAAGRQDAAPHDETDGPKRAARNAPEVAAADGTVASPIVAAPNGDDVQKVSHENTISADFITCLEDGLRFKSLKRHLKARYGMTPDDYRRKWGLPEDYPMVAPNYSRVRARIAKSSGFANSVVAEAPKTQPKRSKAA